MSTPAAGAHDPHAGPFDRVPWPTELLARVTTPGPAPRVQGYDVEGDLAKHGYRFTDLVLLSLVGELPSEAQGRAFDVALTFLAPLAAHEAPTHAAMLARICAANTSSITATGAIGLAELARFTMEAHAPFIAWLDAGAQGSLPAGCVTQREDDREAVERLRAALEPSPLAVSALAHDLTRMAALLAVLHACGLRRAEQLEVALTVARLATTTAEALAAPPAAFKEYPMGLPPFRYAEGP
jgi:hypothetical protein